MHCDIAEGGATKWQVCVASSHRRFHDKTIFRITENRFTDVWGIRDGISKSRIQADMNGPASAGTRMYADPVGWNHTDCPAPPGRHEHAWYHTRPES